jgi:hypothetical protein
LYPHVSRLRRSHLAHGASPSTSDTIKAPTVSRKALGGATWDGAAVIHDLTIVINPL